LNEKYYKQNKEIDLLINDGNEIVTIDINMKRKTYFSKQYDITIIEINENDGLELDNFLEIDCFENILNENISNYINNQIYMIQYGIKENKPELFLSKGFINRINGDNKRIFYDCLSSVGSGGSPIINAKTNKVIGVHRGRDSRNDIRMGALILISVKHYINTLISNNSINCSLTENLMILYESPNNNKEEDSLNSSVDSYKKIFGISIQKEPINGIKLSNILSQSDNPDSSFDLNPLNNSNKNNYNNMKEIDNFYEGNFDVETKIIKFKDYK